MYNFTFLKLKIVIENEKENFIYEILTKFKKEKKLNNNSKFFNQYELTSSMVRANRLLYGCFPRKLSCTSSSVGKESGPTTSSIPYCLICAYAIFVTFFKSSWAPTLKIIIKT